MGSRWLLCLGPYVIHVFTLHWDFWLKARPHQTQIFTHPIALNIAPNKHIFSHLKPACQRRKWQPTRVFLPGEVHGQRSLVGYSPWDRRVGHDWETKTYTDLLTYYSCAAISMLRSDIFWRFLKSNLSLLFLFIMAKSWKRLICPLVVEWT